MTNETGSHLALSMTIAVIGLLVAYYLGYNIYVAPLLVLFWLGILALFLAVTPARSSWPRGYFLILSAVAIAVSVAFAYGGIR